MSLHYVNDGITSAQVPMAAPAAPRERRGLAAPCANGRFTTLLGILDQGVVSLTNFGTTVIVGKVAGITDLGIYSLGFTVVLFALAVQECFVVAPYTVFQVGKKNGPRRMLLGSMVLLGLAIAAACSLVVIVFAAATGGGSSAPLATIAVALALALPGALLRELVRRVALAHFELPRTLLIDLGTAVVQIGCLLTWAVLGKLTATTALVAMAAGGAAGASILLVQAKRQMRFRWHAVRAHSRDAFHFGKWLCGARLTSVLNSYVVLYLLGLMVGLDAVGGFTAAFVLIAAANPLLMGFTNVLAPRTAHAWAAGGAASLRAVVFPATIWLTAVTAVFSAAVALGAGQIMSFLYGPLYAQYAHVGAVLTASLLAGIIGVPSDHGLRAAQRPKASLTANAAGLVVTITLTLVLVPFAGPVGAAYAMTLGCAVSAVLRCAAFVRLTRVQTGPSMAHVRGDQ